MMSFFGLLRLILQSHSLRIAVAFCLMSGLGCYGVEVTAQVERVGDAGQRAASHVAQGAVVVWLTPLTGDPAPVRPRHFRLEQKDKQFSPRILVVPTGSVVDFPNLDPFFHNVFSLFNGKRFDLGLYEEGSTRAVHFDNAGVSYIFCNIHPQMHAVVITVSTPYVAFASPNGLVNFRNVPPGDYRLQVWAENADLRQLESLTHEVHVSGSATALGRIKIQASTELANHANKYGEPYSDTDSSPY